MEAGTACLCNAEICRNSSLATFCPAQKPRLGCKTTLSYFKKYNREKWGQGVERVVHIAGIIENGWAHLWEEGLMNLSFSAVMSLLHEMSHFLRPPFAGKPNSQGWKRLSQNPAGALDIWEQLTRKIESAPNELEFLKWSRVAMAATRVCATGWGQDKGNS